MSAAAGITKALQLTCFDFLEQERVPLLVCNTSGTGKHLELRNNPLKHNDAVNEWALYSTAST